MVSAPESQPELTKVQQSYSLICTRMIQMTPHKTCEFSLRDSWPSRELTRSWILQNANVLAIWKIHWIKSLSVVVKTALTYLLLDTDEAQTLATLIAIYSIKKIILHVRWYRIHSQSLQRFQRRCCHRCRWIAARERSHSSSQLFVRHQEHFEIEGDEEPRGIVGSPMWHH